MSINKLTLKQSMNKQVQAIMPLEEEKKEFSNKLIQYLTHLLDTPLEFEEHQKFLLKYFLESLLPYNFINTSERIDLAIYNGNTADSTLGVLFECKSLSNKTEMMSKERLNSKAFQEIVAYYLNERLNNNNIEIKKCIITNGLSWFVIESSEMEKYFFNNKELIKNIKKFNNNQLVSKKTDFLYTDVISPEISKAIEKGITIAHFNLKDSLKDNTKYLEVHPKKVTQLYRFFTAENLLNKEIFSDSNKLNKGFYDELLYLMGLEEVSKGNSKIISRLKVKSQQRYSFVENVIDKLDMKDIDKDKQEDLAIQLTVIWINRILFSKLLESQLVLFNNDDSYKFLTYEKISSFEDLYSLFFAVLAKKIPDRNERVQEKFGYVPYLNSSLFEETSLELSNNGIGIDRLPEGDIEIYSKTILKGSNKKKKTGKINFLVYLFEFLDAYDFSTTISHNKKSKNELINASVLGLIFEKINGYKDGSFYTPGSITTFMAKKAIRRTVIDKINENFSWTCESVEEIKYCITNFENGRSEAIKRINSAIDEIKICDPAVGSGHFLVSILNELIAIKSELNVLLDADGSYIGHLIQCYVINDELIVQDMSGDNFIYQNGNTQSQKIQKAIFNMKRQILENSLFAVDINPSSVNICRLRLWIELLKSSYYYQDKKTGMNVLTTLPNIDINIKVGDSLLHKFDIDYSFDMRRTDFKDYVSLVKQYKETNDKRIKSDIWDKINKVKISFDETASSKELQDLYKLETEFISAQVINLFGDETQETQRFKLISKKIKEAKKALEIRLKNPLYAGGMEWRMEFPELLGANGEFLGFDLVIGNPPYIFARNKSFTEEMENYYTKTYKVSEYQSNTYTLFIELAFMILKKGGQFAYIIPNNFLTIQSNSKIRKFITTKTSDVLLINSLDKIFTDASVDNCIVFFKKDNPNWIELAELKSEDVVTIGKVNSNYFGTNPMFSISMVKYKEAIDIFWKIDSVPKLDRVNVATVKSGIMAYETGKGKPKMTAQDKNNRIFHSKDKLNDSYRKYIDGENVSRYRLTWNGEYIRYGDNLAAKRDPKLFENPRILVRQIPSKQVYSIEAVYVNEDIINDRNSMIITDIKMNPYALLGILNSRIMSLWFLMRFDKFQRRIFPQFKINELGEFPIPEINLESQNNIAISVKNIMKEYSKEAPDKNIITNLNLEIDDMVMDTFNLNDEEKHIVKNFYF